MSNDKILMPKELTAENGAKGLLIGEFKEYVCDIGCVECGGPQARNNDDCPACNGHGIVQVTADVTWTTIKEIYAMAAKHLGEEVADAS